MAVALAVGFLGAEFRWNIIDDFFRRYPVIVLPLLAAGDFFQMEASNENPFTSLKAAGALWSFLAALCVYLILYALTNRAWLSGMLGALLFTIWALVNYFTLQFRGTPVSPGDMFSAGTAMDMVQSGKYHLSFSGTVLLILVIFLMQSSLIISVFGVKGSGTTRIKIIRGMVFAVAGVWLWAGYMTQLPGSVGLYRVEWSWTENYYPKGYLCTTLMRVPLLFYQKPAGYSDQAVCDIVNELIADNTGSAQAEAKRPNVVLIVNESWFDWRQAEEFTASAPVMSFVDQLDNCVRGFAVNPVVGTSASEYEVLTSNSMCLFPTNNPFTQMDMTKGNSLPRYLKELGYKSIAMHPCPSENYNRYIVYPDLGFDRSYFYEDSEIWEDDPVFIHGGYSDADCFHFLQRLFEENKEEKPLFLYNLTFQNHGGYQMADVNGGDWETDPDRWITVTDGFEYARSEAEEYLTSISYTDEAFSQLVEYFSQQEEPTIICMVGDHSPYFSTEDPDRLLERGQDVIAHELGTPFVIWANYPIEEENIGYIGMPQLAAILLKTAGIELSPYYQAILDMTEEIPLLGSHFYETSDGKFAEYNFEEKLPEALNRYLNLEYSSIARGTQKDDRLVLPFSQLTA